MIYPTDFVTIDGHWQRLHQGHNLDRDTLVTDLEREHGPAKEGFELRTAEHYLHFQPRVKWCRNHGDPCDEEGHWHSHWQGVKPNDDPRTMFTAAWWDLPERGGQA